jgi:hypothetical protein
MHKMYYGQNAPPSISIDLHFRMRTLDYPPITYYWTVPLILDHSYLVGNLTNLKIAETNALEPLKS